LLFSRILYNIFETIYYNTLPHLLPQGERGGLPALYQHGSGPAGRQGWEGREEL